MSFRSLRLTAFFAFTLLFISCSETGKNPYQKDVKAESYQTAPAPDQNTVYKFPLIKNSRVKNIIFFIGDGTSLTQLQVAQQHLQGEEGLLAIQRMPVTGLVKTYSADNLITDSAAGATAYSTGTKTRNGMIGQAPDTTAMSTLLELAKARGMKAGVVATSSITHATPASFVAHIDNRYKENQIAEQMVASDADVMLGGGRGFFVPSSDSASEREDDNDLLSLAKENGFQVLLSREELLSSSNEGRLLGLFSEDGLEGTDREPTLAEMTDAAINHLENDNGFFLMVEGSQIDWAGHDNNLEYLLEQVRGYDQAIAKAIQYALNDEETLIVATADHETGGLTLINGHEDRDEMEIIWTTSHHTGVQVPLFAFGPRAMEFTGVWQNIQIGQKMADILNLGTFPVKK
jgi:alkaline phosphatase